MFHRVGREKRPVIGELVLGVCAKGIIVYEMKNHLRTVTRRFLWRETDSIATGVKFSATHVKYLPKFFYNESLTYVYNLCPSSSSGVN